MQKLELQIILELSLLGESALAVLFSVILFNNTMASEGFPLHCNRLNWLGYNC